MRRTSSTTINNTNSSAVTPTGLEDRYANLLDAGKLCVLYPNEEQDDREVGYALVEALTIQRDALYFRDVDPSAGQDILVKSWTRIGLLVPFNDTNRYDRKTPARTAADIHVGMEVLALWSNPDSTYTSVYYPAQLGYDPENVTNKVVVQYENGDVQLLDLQVEICGYRVPSVIQKVCAYGSLPLKQALKRDREKTKKERTLKNLREETEVWSKRQKLETKHQATSSPSATQQALQAIQKMPKKSNSPQHPSYHQFQQQQQLQSAQKVQKLLPQKRGFNSLSTATAGGAPKLSEIKRSHLRHGEKPSKRGKLAPSASSPSSRTSSDLAGSDVAGSDVAGVDSGSGSGRQVIETEVLEAVGPVNTGSEEKKQAVSADRHFHRPLLGSRRTAQITRDPNLPQTDFFSDAGFGEDQLSRTSRSGPPSSRDAGGLRGQLKSNKKKSSRRSCASISASSSSSSSAFSTSRPSSSSKGLWGEYEVSFPQLAPVIDPIGDLKKALGGNKDKDEVEELKELDGEQNLDRKTELQSRDPTAGFVSHKGEWRNWLRSDTTRAFGKTMKVAPYVLDW